MTLKKPAHIRSNKQMSKIWDNLVKSGHFKEHDAPLIALLVQWQAVSEQCMSDIIADGDLKMTTDDGKAAPQLATLKQASSEMRAIMLQLEQRSQEQDKKPAQPMNTLQLITLRRQKKAAQ